MAIKRVMTKVNEPAKVEYKGVNTLDFQHQVNNFIDDLNKGEKEAFELLETNTLYTFKSTFRYYNLTTYVVKFGNRVMLLNKHYDSYGTLHGCDFYSNGIKEEVITLKDMQPIAGQKTIKILTLYIYRGNPIEVYIDENKNELIGINKCTYYKTDSINLMGNDKGMYLNLIDPKYNLKNGVYLNGFHTKETNDHIKDVQTIETDKGDRIVCFLIDDTKVAVYPPYHKETQSIYLVQDYSYQGH